MAAVLKPISDSVYASWYDRAVEDYAADHARTGQMSADEAITMARRQFQELLPDGPRTPDQYLYEICDADIGAVVGILWFAKRGEGAPHAFIYALEVFPEHRRRGYARSAMLALEAEVRRVGLSRIGLHVFGDNAGAIRLYQSLGYMTTNLVMKKELDAAGEA